MGLALKPFPSQRSLPTWRHIEIPFRFVCGVPDLFHPGPAFTIMPNQRQPGTKLAGAYISAEKDKALAEIAAQKGYANKAEFIRALFDAAIEENEQILRNKPKR